MKCIADIMAPWSAIDSHHDYHWHRYVPDHDGFMSIWVDRKNWGEWWVEIYPDPESPRGEETRFGFDSPEEAAKKVADLMEKHQ